MVTIPITIHPVSFISDFPPEIQEVYYRSQNIEKKKEALKKAMIVKKVVALIAALFICVWMAHIAGARTFDSGFESLGWLLMFVAAVKYAGVMQENVK